MAVILTIGGTSVTFIEDTLDITYSLDERQRLQCDIIDYTGSLHFVKGEQVVLTDPVLGVMFNGYLNSDQEFDIYPTGGIRHTIDCIDQHYLADKRTYTRTYNTPQLAGKLVVDQLNSVLAPEGITQNYAQHADSTVADFAQGILSNVTTANTLSDGELELPQVGTALSITQAGAANTSYQGIKIIGYCAGGYANAYWYQTIWAGSYTVVSNDSLNYYVFVSSSSPMIAAGIDLLFSDGTRYSNLVDQTSSGSADDEEGLNWNPSTDLSGYANDQWYRRTFNFSSPIVGKTIKQVMVAFGGNSTGSYTAYFRDIGIQDVNFNDKFLFFSTTATSLNTNKINSTQGYSNFAIEVLPVYDILSIFTYTYPLSGVGIVGSSLINFVADTPATNVNVSGVPATTTAILQASIDGGASYQSLTTRTSIPCLPNGLNVTSQTLIIQVIQKTNQCEIPPTFGGYTLTVLPSYQTQTTKIDLQRIFQSASDFNTGTLSNLQTLLSGGVTLTGSTDNFASNSGRNIYTQFTSYSSGTTLGSYSQIYRSQLKIWNGGGSNSDTKVRLDVYGQWQNFIVEVDAQAPSATGNASLCYRTTTWSNANNSFAYAAEIGSDGTVYLVKGTNSAGGSSTNTVIAQVSTGIQSGTMHRLKVTVSGNSHTIYVDDVQLISATDSTYTSAGYIALRYYNNSAALGSTFFQNYGITSSLTGTWTSPSINLSSLTSYANSLINWQYSTDPTTAVTLQTSVDGGSTWADYTSGNIAGISSGSIPSTLKIRATLTSASATSFATLYGLSTLLLSQYSSSGTRSTIPLGNDTMVRSNVAGSFGTAFDSQTYTKVGTGTTNLTSNEGQITNTTGDVHMLLGSRIWTDEDGTVRFSLSAATITGGIELRYQDVNNFYRLAATTTTFSIIKKSTGTTTTLASTSISLSTGVFYWLRFRAVGNGPVNLYGRVWADGTKEDQTTWTITASV